MNNNIHHELGELHRLLRGGVSHQITAVRVVKKSLDGNTKELDNYSNEIMSGFVQ